MNKKASSILHPDFAKLIQPMLKTAQLISEVGLKILKIIK